MIIVIPTFYEVLIFSLSELGTNVSPVTPLFVFNVKCERLVDVFFSTNYFYVTETKDERLPTQLSTCLSVWIVGKMKENFLEKCVLIERLCFL